MLDRSTLMIALVTVSLATASGCSISTSSQSISDSISSPSESISKSSDSSSGGGGDSQQEAPAPEPEEDTTAYQQDVSQMTVTYVKSGGDIGAFRSTISGLAKARGISDWEADAVTTEAIGSGAGTAGLQETAFEDFSKNLVGNDLTKLNELRKGYQKTAPPASVSTPASSNAPTNTTTQSPATSTPPGSVPST